MADILPGTIDEHKMLDSGYRRVISSQTELLDDFVRRQELEKGQTSHRFMEPSFHHRHQDYTTPSTHKVETKPGLKIQAWGQHVSKDQIPKPNAVTTKSAVPYLNFQDEVKDKQKTLKGELLVLPPPREADNYVLPSSEQRNMVQCENAGYIPSHPSKKQRAVPMKNTPNIEDFEQPSHTKIHAEENDINESGTSGETLKDVWTKVFGSTVGPLALMQSQQLSLHTTISTTPDEPRNDDDVDQATTTHTIDVLSNVEIYGSADFDNSDKMDKWRTQNGAITSWDPCTNDHLEIVNEQTRCDRSTLSTSVNEKAPYDRSTFSTSVNEQVACDRITLSTSVNEHAINDKSILSTNLNEQVAYDRRTLSTNLNEQVVCDRNTLSTSQNVLNPIVGATPDILLHNSNKYIFREESEMNLVPITEQKPDSSSTCDEYKRIENNNLVHDSDTGDSENTLSTQNKNPDDTSTFKSGTRRIRKGARLSSRGRNGSFAANKYERKTASSEDEIPQSQASHNTSSDFTYCRPYETVVGKAMKPTSERCWIHAYTDDETLETGQMYKNILSQSRRSKSLSSVVDGELILLAKRVHSLEVSLANLTKKTQLRARNSPLLSSASSSERSAASPVKHRRYRKKRINTDSTHYVRRRFNRLESHVVTLARSIAQLSSEISHHHSSLDELTSTTQRLQQESTTVSDSGTTAKQQRWAISIRNNVNSRNKLRRFFGEEPPMLKEFLNKLGYLSFLSKFQEESINVVELPFMTERRLEQLGIPVGPRVRILQEAQKILHFPHTHFQ